MQRTPLLLLSVVGLALGCGAEEPADPAAADAASRAWPSESQALARIGDGPHPVVALEMGELGSIEIELYPEIAPATVEHFRKLVARGVYDGTRFHRVLPGFMIQGGDPKSRKPNPNEWGRGNAGQSIEDELSDYPHLRGTVSMANRGKPRTAGSQFFIVHQDAPEVDGRYTAFGRVVRGMEVVDRITEMEIDKYGRYGPPDRPYPVDVVLTKATLQEPAPQVAGSAAPAAPPGPAERASEDS